MPFKDPKVKQAYNRKYHQQKLGKEGSYNTVRNLEYPEYLDYKDNPLLGSSFKIGRRRLREFKNILLAEYPKEEGYHIWMNRIEGREIDVKVKKNDKLHTVIELTNYSKKSSFKAVTTDRYIDEFDKYEGIRKIIVVSYPENIKQWRQIFQKKDIEIREMGYQA